MKFLRIYCLVNAILLIFFGAMMKLKGSTSHWEFVAGMLHFTAFLLITYRIEKLRS